MKLSETPTHRQALSLERPSWLVTCALKRREPFGTVSSQAKYELAADNEEDARSAVRSYVQQSHPTSLIVSMRVTRQSQSQMEMQPA